MKSNLLIGLGLGTLFVPNLLKAQQGQPTPQMPNVIFIYADDLGYGDLECYGATRVQTPNVNKLANSGIRFTNTHATAATSTPSRYMHGAGRVRTSLPVTPE